MYEVPNSFDGSDSSPNPQVPPVIGSNTLGSTGSPDFLPTDITAPEVTRPEPDVRSAVANHAGALATPAEVSVTPPGGNDPENMPSGTGAEEPVEAPDTGQAGQPPDLPPPPAKSQETGPEPDPDAAKLGDIFDMLNNFNQYAGIYIGDILLKGSTGQESGDEEVPPELIDDQPEIRVTPADVWRTIVNGMVQRVDGGTLESFGLELDSDQVAGPVGLRLRDGYMLLGKLQEIPDGAVPEPFVKGFQKLVDNFPMDTHTKVLHMDFAKARETGGLDIEGVIWVHSPDELNEYAASVAGKVTPGERAAMLSTLTYADGISDELARFGVTEDSLQELRNIKRYAQEGKLTEWAVATELGLNADLDKTPLEDMPWGSWTRQGAWDGAFKFLDYVHRKSQPEGTFLPDLVGRLDANLTRVLDSELSPEAIASGTVDEPYVGLLQLVQQRLQTYR